jgi:hypothetical protein
VWSLLGSTAVDCILRNVVRFYEPFRGIALNLLHYYSVLDNEITWWFKELLLLKLLLPDSIIGCLNSCNLL